MSRYSFVHTFTDQEAKVGSVPYDNVKSKSESETVSNEAGKEKFRFNKVDNVSGSTAGAGSGEFHMYRAARRREMERLSSMEHEHKKKVEEAEFQEKRKRIQESLAEKTRQKAAKRRRKQENAKIKKMMGQNENRTEVEHDNEEDALLEKMPGGVDEIANDGTFLQTILEQQKLRTEANSH
jgi:hypothetical protein